MKNKSIQENLLDKIRANIDKVKTSQVDRVIVSFHWGA